MTIFDEEEEEEQIDARSSIPTEESTVDDFFTCEAESTIQSLGDQSTLKEAPKDSSSSSSSTVPDGVNPVEECDSLMDRIILIKIQVSSILSMFLLILNSRSRAQIRNN